jgi:hypothetical protein
MISEGKHKRKTTESNTETKQKCRDPHFDRLCTTYYLKNDYSSKTNSGCDKFRKKILSIPLNMKKMTFESTAAPPTLCMQKRAATLASMYLCAHHASREIMSKSNIRRGRLANTTSMQTLKKTNGEIDRASTKILVHSRTNSFDFTSLLGGRRRRALGRSLFLPR